MFKYSNYFFFGRKERIISELWAHSSLKMMKQVYNYYMYSLSPPLLPRIKNDTRNEAWRFTSVAYWNIKSVMVHKEIRQLCCKFVKKSCAKALPINASCTARFIVSRIKIIFRCIIKNNSTHFSWTATYLWMGRVCVCVCVSFISNNYYTTSNKPRRTTQQQNNMAQYVAQVRAEQFYVQ